MSSRMRGRVSPAMRSIAAKSDGAAAGRMVAAGARFCDADGDGVTSMGEDGARPGAAAVIVIGTVDGIAAGTAEEMSLEVVTLRVSSDAASATACNGGRSR